MNENKIRIMDIHVCNICKVETKSLKRHLRSNHNITDEYYYNEYIRNSHYIPDCILPSCSNKVRFYNHVRGYNIGCCSNHTKMCQVQSESTRSIKSTKMKGRVISPETRDKMSKSALNKIVSDKTKLIMSIKRKEHNKTYEGKLSHSLRDKNNLLSLRDKGYDLGILYIFNLRDCIKIGALGYISDNINPLGHKLWKYKPPSWVAYSGSIEDIAEQEFLIKINNTSIKGLEYFDLSIKDKIILELNKSITLHSTSK